MRLIPGLKIWILFLVGTARGTMRGKPAEDQLINYKERTKGSMAIMTTSSGMPIECVDAMQSINRRLIYNVNFLESLTHLVRERTPERVVHAKGAGAFGYFEVTHDITNICKAKLFSEVGKRTPVAVRFSTVAGERGSSDLTRETRGFAVKFYTEEGNWDFVGLNVPMFAMKDPILFPAFSRVQKRNPATNLQDGNMLWDFITLHPESLHVFMLVFADRGIPRGFRKIPGFSIHTYQVQNRNGESFFVRFHILSEDGIDYFTSEEAQKIQAVDPDYFTRDLFNAIGRGEYPEWTVYIQVLTLKDVNEADIDVFDITKTLPQDKYPLKPVGRLVLNKNPNNFYADVEQLAFCPGNLVPGILGGPDKVFEARVFSYRDAHNYRLGTNVNKIAVNCPFRSLTYTYNRDGVPPVKDNDRDAPNYYPNSFNGPKEYVDPLRAELLDIWTNPGVDNFDQVTELYVNEFTKKERSRLVKNIVASIRPVAKFLQQRAVELFTMVHPDLGTNIQIELAKNTTNMPNINQYNRTCM